VRRGRSTSSATATARSPASNALWPPASRATYNLGLDASAHKGGKGSTSKRPAAKKHRPVKKAATKKRTSTKRSAKKGAPKNKKAAKKKTAKKKASKKK
jgi:hypothetical protein